MPYPLGGLIRQETDLGSVELPGGGGVTYGTGVYTPTGANALDLKGLVLARAVAGTKLVAYVAAQFGTDSTGTPIAILGDDVQADGTPSDVDLNYIANGNVRKPILHTAAAPTSLLTIADIDRLQTEGLIVQDTQELQKFDN